MDRKFVEITAYNLISKQIRMISEGSCDTED